MVSEKLKLIGIAFLWSIFASAAPIKQTDCPKVLPIKAPASSAPTDRLKIALVPFKIEGLKTLPEFLAKIEKAVAEAAQAGAGLVVFPELNVSDLVDAGEK
jgi:hypothetical protein